MKPARFQYLAPRSVAEALDCLQEHGTEAKILAGGQSLVPLLNLRLAQPACLVDINPIKELAYIRTANGGLAFGALARQSDVLRSPLVRERCPLLAEVTAHIGHPQTRNRGTLVGSLAHNDPAADYPAAALVLDMTVQVRGPAGERTVNVDDLLGELYGTSLAPDELIVEARVPAPPLRTGWAFCEFARRPGDFALAGVAVRLTLAAGGRTCQAARIALIGAGNRARLAAGAAQGLAGQELSDRLLQQAGEQAAAEADPPADLHADADYRRHLLKVLVPRTLRQARDRAGGGT